MIYMDLIQEHLPSGCYVESITLRFTGLFQVEVRGCGNLMDLEPFMEQTSQGWMALTANDLTNYSCSHETINVSVMGMRTSQYIPSFTYDSATIFLSMELTYEEAAARLMQALMEK